MNGKRLTLVSAALFVTALAAYAASAIADAMIARDAFAGTGTIHYVIAYALESKP